jgi:hypothetical protein
MSTVVEGRDCTCGLDCPSFVHLWTCPTPRQGWTARLTSNTVTDGPERFGVVDPEGIYHLVLSPGHDHEADLANDGACNGRPDCTLHPVA